MAIPEPEFNQEENFKEIWDYLLNSRKLPYSSVCGIVANMEKESNFDSTAFGDGGTSYGLCQWHNTRFSDLKEYCKMKDVYYTYPIPQLDFMIYELQNSYKNLYDKLLEDYPDSIDGAYNAGYDFCTDFEKPAGGLTSARERGQLAQRYWQKMRASSNIPPVASPADDKGNLIVTEARKHAGKSYVLGTEGPDTFDCSGLVYYVYKKAIDFDEWGRGTAYDQYMYTQSNLVSGPWSAGDLVFFTDTYDTGKTPNISHVAIAIGDGDKIIQAGPKNGVMEFSLSTASDLNAKYYATTRLVADSETSGTNVEESFYDISQNQTRYNDELFDRIMYSEDVDRYLNAMLSARNSIESVSGSNIYDYGYLVDLTNGGEFRFIVPEHETSIKANWNISSVIGRSADIVSYNNTSSKSITITLDLIAGAGLYIGDGDKVSEMHNDIAFVQSLEYPDYTKAIAFPPPVVYLYLNNLVQIRGVVDSVSVRYQKPFELPTNRPMKAELTFTVVQVSENPPDFTDIRNRADNSF